jgi:hypothetical protein
MGEVEMKKGIVVCLATLGLALATNPASAQSVSSIYEGFNYTPGLTLDGSGGLNGGTGGGGNSWGEYGLSANSNYQITSGSLSDPTSTLLTSGNQVSTTAPGAGFDGRYFGYLPGQGNSGSNLFYSILIRPDNLGTQGQTGSGGDGGFIFQLFGGGGQNGVAVGVNGSNPNWALQEGTITSASGIAAVSNVTAFLAVEVEYGASTDTELLYVNPTPGAAQPGTPSATMTYNIGNQNGLGLNTFNGAYATFDEIRGGTTWASVTPVPEPSTFALVGLFALFPLLIRRRK